MGRGKLNGLDLFSGIAGNTLALRDYVRIVAYCEQDRHAQAVLLSRMVDGSISAAPIWDDITSLRGEHLDTPIDIIIAGFPCQDISVAGRGEGLEGQRSGLFFEVLRLIDEIQPPFVFLENVPAIRTRGGERVVKELASRGYDCRWDTLSAFDVGAPHKRERWFLLAYNLRVGRGEGWTQSAVLSGGNDTPGGSAGMANANSTGLEIRQPRDTGEQQTVVGTSGWQPEPDVCRVVNGLPYRVDRIKRLGNAVVPAQAREAFERLMGLK